MIEPPDVVRTERLLLRFPAPSDAEAIFEYARDPEATRFTNWPAHMSIATSLAFLSACLTRLAAGEEFSWVLTVPPSDQAIGMISCRVRGHAADFGYALHRGFWNQGFATEAARAIVGWAFTLDSIHRVWATCDVDNAASVRVLEKSGLSREGILRRWEVRPNLSSEPRDAFVYSRVREAPQPARVAARTTRRR